MRGLSDDITIENNIHRIVSVTINRINQFSEEFKTKLIEGSSIFQITDGLIFSTMLVSLSAV